MTRSKDDMADEIYDLEEKVSTRNVALVFLGIVLFVIIGYLIINHHYEPPKYETWCHNTYGASAFITESEREYPTNIKVCNEIKDNGEITKHYFNINNLDGADLKEKTK